MNTIISRLGSISREGLKRYQKKQQTINSLLLKYQCYVGFEVHCQLQVDTKLFSPGLTHISSEIEANSSVGLFDIACPGVLPITNQECVHKSLISGYALHCKLANILSFDRKHYYYPDLPNAYQITQKFNPIAYDGYYEYFDNSGSIQRMEIERIQLEQDSARVLNDSEYSCLDFRRAGIPLIEIVTRPSFINPIDGGLAIGQLQTIIKSNKISLAILEEV